MEIELEPGKYVVAVSGGVDSVVLLNLLYNNNHISRMAPCKLVVAHFDHGIRDNSREDRLFVQSLAIKYDLPFVFDEGRLGAAASEAAAREARYKFLRWVKEISGAGAIITAHHEDDLLETAVMNLLRGTGRKGLSSLKSTGEVLRPLLGISKRQILELATARGLEWREDSTNADVTYRRNYIRHKVMPRFSNGDRRMLRALLDAANKTNHEIDFMLSELLDNQNSPNELNRRWFIDLPHAICREVLAAWLRSRGVAFDKKGIERMVVSAKTFSLRKIIDVDRQNYIDVGRETLKLTERKF
jgi:tRNA(Ile)-lysidine synthetase-like protein